MKKMFIWFFVIFALLMTIPSFAADKVVVIPLNKASSMDSQAVANQGILDGCGANIEDGNSFASCFFQPVPTGKILVVEFVSGNIRISQGDTFYIHARTSNPIGTFTHHNIFARYQAIYSSSESIYVVSQPFRYYVDEGQSLGMVFHKNDSTGHAYGDFFITGYYVDKK